VDPGRCHRDPKNHQAEGIDLVLIGTHGRKGLELVFFGSVAENAVERSPAPVLTINPYKVKQVVLLKGKVQC
jgi:hypothetical protein